MNSQPLTFPPIAYLDEREPNAHEKHQRCNEREKNLCRHVKCPVRRRPGVSTVIRELMPVNTENAVLAFGRFGKRSEDAFPTRQVGFALDRLETKWQLQHIIGKRPDRSGPFPAWVVANLT